MMRSACNLLALLSLSGLLLPAAAQAQAESPLASPAAAVSSADIPTEVPVPDATVTIDANHELVPAGIGQWTLRDKTTGSEKQLLLPAFHPVQSRPVLDGDRLAYITLTHRDGRMQLGCVNVDTLQGRVVDRIDSRLLARADESTASRSPVFDGNGKVHCALNGERCTSPGHCVEDAETVTLSTHVHAAARAVKGKTHKTRHARGQSAKSAKSSRAGQAHTKHHHARHGKPGNGHGVKPAKKVSRKTSSVKKVPHP
ncbi:MAG: hypothetical protein JSR19_08715 [Proteobacteria bacterium]|nr:hypothetical protein [Pseudomonadota bacterium]HQR04157.1 hypothetical protein [Rhodocyclaceae bacterium]